MLGYSVRSFFHELLRLVFRFFLWNDCGCFHQTSGRRWSAKPGCSRPELTVFSSDMSRLLSIHGEYLSHFLQNKWKYEKVYQASSFLGVSVGTVCTLKVPWSWTPTRQAVSGAVLANIFQIRHIAEYGLYMTGVSGIKYPNSLRCYRVSALYSDLRCVVWGSRLGQLTSFLCAQTKMWCGG